MDIYNSPIGQMAIETTSNRLKAIDFSINLDKKIIETKTSYIVKKQLDEYFAGKRHEFTIELELSGTAYQKIVWQNVMTVKYGETMSYKEIAILSNSPKSARAVGMANNKNKIPIIIPCHRIIGSNGDLVGYGGGIDKKVFLLDLESKFLEGF
ncbi:MAG: methylated-DNA--[protein]-cysteine S-methyltransferase [Lachnospirales bacterium]